MNKWILSTFLMMSIGFSWLFSQNTGEVKLKLNTQKTTDTFDGIGAVSAGASSRLLIDYPEPYRSQILDYLFKPYYGASLQHLKVEIGGDINSTDGSEPSHMRTRDDENYQRGYEWWLMKEARKRNPDIILDALSWGAPGWIGDGNYYSQDGADYIVKFLKGAKKHHGLDINFVGIWNERDFNVGWIKLLRKTLDKNGLESVRIVASDMNGPPEKMWEIADSMAADPILKEAVYAIGVHYPHGETPATALQLKAEGKKLWSTEDGEWNWYTMLPYRHMRTHKLNHNYIERKLTKTEFWSPVTSYYDCLPAPFSGMIKANTPWSGAYEIEKILWSVAHTTQFAKPGWYFLENACIKLPEGGSVVSYTNPEKNEISIIIETTEARKIQEIEIEIENLPELKKLRLWQSDDLKDFIQSDDLQNTDGRFRLQLKPRAVYSLTSTSGQHKGRATSPNPAAFPLPYREDFDSYEPGKIPKYLSDQSGAWEVVAENKKNKNLVQQIHREGIDWSRTATAFSLLGEVNWSNIEVSVDVSFKEVVTAGGKDKIFASVIARDYQGAVWACFQADNPIAYNLRLYADGTWKLLTANDLIAEGIVPAPGDNWINLKLSCKEDIITVCIDNRKVSEIRDPLYKRGLVGIGSSFHPVAFDNLIIKSTE